MMPRCRIATTQSGLILLPMFCWWLRLNKDFILSCFKHEYVQSFILIWWPYTDWQQNWIFHQIIIMMKQGKSEGFETCDRPIVRKRPIWVKIGDVLSRVTLKFDGWPWKTIGHLSFAVSSFVQQFVATGELNWSYSPKTPNLGQIRRFLEPCDLEIWWMTLKNNRAPLLCFFKLYAWFRSHRWIQAGVIVWKRPIWVKIDDFF